MDSSWDGTDGETVTLATRATANIYTTVQAALTAADAQTGSITIRVNEGANAGIYNENITFPSGLASTDYVELIGEGQKKIAIGSTTSGDACTFADGDAEFWVKGIRFRGAAASHSVTTSATNVTAHFEDCEFDTSVSGDWSRSSFRRCQFDGGYDIDSGHTPNQVYFESCAFNGACAWAADTSYHLFIGAQFTTSATLTVTDGSHVSAKFKNCRFDAASAITLNGSNVTATGWDFDSGCTFTNTAGANGHIYFQDVSGVNGFIIRASFTHGSGSTNPYIKSADTAVRGVQVMANFQRDGTGNYVEDSGGVSVTGIFVDSVFGPCSPPDFGLTLDTGSNDCMYLGTRAVTGTDPDEAYRPITQTGTATPTHDAPESTLYWDTDSDILYINTDGSSTWAKVGSAGAGGGHTLLDGSTHTDTEVDTPTKGDIIVGDGTNVKWQALGVGTDGQVLTADSATADIGIKWATPSAGSVSPLVLANDITHTIDGAAGNSNNINPTGLATANVIALTTSGGSTLTGITAQSDEFTLWLYNTGTTAITLQHDVTSTDGNRFFCPGDTNYTIDAHGSVLVKYDADADGAVGKWVVAGRRTPSASASNYTAYRSYDLVPDAAVGVDASTGVQTCRLPTHDQSSAVTETMTRVTVACSAAGTAGTILIEKADGVDEDTATWSTAYTITLSSGHKGVTFTSSLGTFTSQTMIRLNISSLTGSWKDVHVHVSVTYPAASAAITVTA